MNKANEYESEPIRGLPERLPPGETILWQGEPRWQSLARRAFHTRSVSIYFAAIIAGRLALGVHSGESPATAAAAALGLVPLALAGVGLLALLAWAMARSTVYTITNKRVVIRFGVALPMTINIPFKIITAAALRTHDDGTGDIPLQLTGTGRIAYLHLWPHARPWRMKTPEPMLRCIPQAVEVAKLLSQALVAAQAGEIAKTEVETTGSAPHRKHRNEERSKACAHAAAAM